ncbi:uncharacterized protein Bfra_000078 [Botrytis fragariae]|uniref:HNH nuclease domain-containing protein n=1 Tax=Botrytis fragariae TaxID=1964551 RepID=A0A8H6B2D6_9HELO|nr:uncharacterized protein Bfra_000078 [Botrytis fragariae]KAF5877915.1 hypothetical protein Bfra_000078 [Botrytis fragariae]
MKISKQFTSSSKHPVSAASSSQSIILLNFGSVINMSFRDRLEECASKLHVGREESTAFKAAIGFLDLMAEHENENLSYQTLVDEGKIFKRTPSLREPEIKKLENYLSTLNPSFPRYWAVKLQLTYLGHADKCEMVRKQRASLEGNAKLLGLEAVYDSILDKWSKNWEAIVVELDPITTGAREQNSYRLAFRIIANNRRPEDAMFTERLKDCHQIRRVSKNHLNIDGSRFAFGDVDFEEVECIVTKTWGPEICRQAVHIVPSRISTAEMSLMFVTTWALNPTLGTYDPKNGLIFEKQIADAWEACQICIVPFVDTNFKFRTWEIRAMDSNLLKCNHMELNCLFRDIHGRQVEVGSIPRIDCLQFHWFLCLAISKNKKFDQQRIEEELIYGKRAWSATDSTGRVKRNLILLLSDAVGRKLPLEITNWKQHDQRLLGYAEIEGLMSKICDVPDATSGLEAGGNGD